MGNRFASHAAPGSQSHRESRWPTTCPRSDRSAGRASVWCLHAGVLQRWWDS